MLRVKLLESNEEFETLLPLIKKFSTKSGIPFWQSVGEASNTFTNPASLFIFGQDGGKVTSYLCGYLLSKTEFMISQLYSDSPRVTKHLLHFLEEYLSSINVETIYALFMHTPRVGEKYGYKVERYLLSKPLSKGGIRNGK